MSGWLPQGVSPRLRRLHGEPVSIDARAQVQAFVRQCVDDGLDCDTIVVMARSHAPSAHLYPELLDHSVERLVDREYGQRGSGKEHHGPQVIDWAAPAPSGDASWCLPQLVEAGTSVSLAGPAKVGKSLLTLEAAAAKAAGRRFLGEVPAPGAVLYWDCENREALVRERLLMMGFDLADLVDLHYVALPHVPRLDTPQFAAQGLDLAEQVQAQLVVLDTTQRVIGGDEESSTGIRALYEHFVTPLRRQGVSVLRLDNTGKELSRGARGSSAKADDVDAAYMLTQRSDRTLLLRRMFTRSATGPGGLFLARQGTPLRHELLGVEETEDADPKGSGRTELQEASTPTAARLIEILDALGVSPGVGRPTCEAALRAAGLSWRTEALAEAVRTRKARG